MTAIASVPVNAKRKLDFAYDYKGRRIEKKVYDWNAGTSAYVLASTTRFIYDGWSVVAELNGSMALTKNYVWGIDLNGSLDSAGGASGLLLCSDGLNTYQYGFDGSGNVAALTKVSTNAVVAIYEYTPFGGTLSAVGEYSKNNRYRFSTQFEDEESGLLYYGYRYLDTASGKWLSRDNLEDTDEVNLYGFTENDAVNYIDILGQKKNYRSNGHHVGHHIVPWSVFNNRVNKEVHDFFNSDAATIFNDYYSNHNAKALHGIKHPRYTQILREELDRYVGEKALKEMTLAEAKNFLRQVKSLPRNHEISRFNRGVQTEANWAARRVRIQLRAATLRAAGSSLQRAFQAGATVAKRGAKVAGVIITAAFFAQAVYSKGFERAYEDEKRDRVNTLEWIVNQGVSLIRSTSIRKPIDEFVKLCSGIFTNGTGLE